MGGFQSALLYPVNLLYVFLPLRWAINIDFIFHVYLIGLLHLGWLRWRGLKPAAALTGAVLLMGSAPFFLHLMPGHLTPLAVMAWAPLVLWSCDALLKRFSKRAFLAGSFALCMQVLAGYPQYLAYTVAGAFLYLLVFGIGRQENSGEKVLWRGWLRIAGMFILAGLLAAVQIGPGLEAAGESVRSSVTRNFAASFSLTPESIITLLAPGFFGDAERQVFWGRFYYWEMTLYFGVAGLALTLYALVRTPTGARTRWLIILVTFYVLALGSNTPLFDLLYQWLPGFGSFRAAAKFTFPLMLFLTLLAGYGADRLLQEATASSEPRAGKPTLSIPIIFAGLTAALLAFALYLRGQTEVDSNGWWDRVFEQIISTDQSMKEASFYGDAANLQSIADFAVKQLYIAAFLCGCVALLFWLCRGSRSRVAGRFLLLLTVTEILIFARVNRPSFPLDSVLSAPLARFLTTIDGDERFIQKEMNYDDIAMATKDYDMGGYDPAMSRRISEFIEWTQGFDPDLSQPYLVFQKDHRLYRMLRCRYIFLDEDRVADMSPVLPHALLVDDYSVISDADRKQRRTGVFNILNSSQFNPARSVILESEPSIKPQKSSDQSKGSVEIVKSSTDSLEIVVTVSKPMIMIVTDTYSSGWRARPLEGSVQSSYEVLPANWVLRAIPLQPGKHHILLEYVPAGFVVGRYVSLMAWGLWLVLTGVWWRKSRRLSGQ